MFGAIEAIFLAIGGLIMPLIVVIIIVAIAKSSKDPNFKGHGDMRPHSEGFAFNRIVRLCGPVDKDKQFMREAKRSGIKRNLVEDNSDDFLARQLREEREKASYVNEMFDLKVSHSASCDAELLKRSHIHDNSIDTGSSR